mmetsp:Transcript_3122/g.8158  ORF Transcript_3122/g.8158 Transcript_3122/m.8158 type:complete len:91 (+) Transcript_3122:337-609(+)
MNGVDSGSDSVKKTTVLITKMTVHAIMTALVMCRHWLCRTLQQQPATVEVIAVAPATQGLMYMHQIIPMAAAVESPWGSRGAGLTREAEA